MDIMQGTCDDVASRSEDVMQLMISFFLQPRDINKPFLIGPKAGRRSC